MKESCILLVKTNPNLICLEVNSGFSMTSGPPYPCTYHAITLLTKGSLRQFLSEDSQPGSKQFGYFDYFLCKMDSL